jgi:triacylglycerol lipase
VLVPVLAPTGSVAERAAELKDFLDAGAPGEMVHIIAHSMGGLDARHAISRLGMGDRVLSLTTLGTPHRGTAFADWGTKHLGPAVRPFLELFGIPAQAFYDLTRESCARFNDETPDDGRVRYFSVAGRFEPDWLTPEWMLPHGIIYEAEGPNDGLVSVASATWGERCDVWEGDHASLVNWPNPVAQLRGRWRDRVPDYLDLVGRLADAGAEPEGIA